MEENTSYESEIYIFLVSYLLLDRTVKKFVNDNFH